MYWIGVATVQKRTVWSALRRTRPSIRMVVHSCASVVHGRKMPQAGPGIDEAPLRRIADTDV
jgi:hypothetical protein